MRLTLRQKAASGGGWFLHSQCILDGLKTTDTVIGANEIDGTERLQLQEMGVKMPTTTENSGNEPRSYPWKWMTKTTT